MQISVQTVAPARLAVLVSRRPAIDFRGVWERLRPEARAQGLLEGKPSLMAIFLADALDGPSGMQWYAAAVELTPDQSVRAPLEELALEGGTYAVGVHVGSYEGLGRAWGELVSNLSTAGHELELTRPCVERYLDDPSVTPAASLRTELKVPVRAAR